MAEAPHLCRCGTNTWTATAPARCVQCGGYRAHADYALAHAAFVAALRSAVVAEAIAETQAEEEARHVLRDKQGYERWLEVARRREGHRVRRRVAVQQLLAHQDEHRGPAHA